MGVGDGRMGRLGDGCRWQESGTARGKGRAVAAFHGVRGQMVAR